MSIQSRLNLGEIDPIIIIGMHRSGTSLVSRVLYELGVHIGANLDNHYESKYFKNINQSLLHDQNACWSNPEPFVSKLDDERFIESNLYKTVNLINQNLNDYGQVRPNQLWGWKDPRNTITLPIWLRIFPEAKVIHVVRNGIDVSISLRKRELLSLFLRLIRGRKGNIERIKSISLIPAYKLWEKYVKLGLLHESNHENMFRLHYEDLTSNPEFDLKGVGNYIGLDITDRQIKNICENIIRNPKKRALIYQLEAHLVFNAGILDSKLLTSLGYKIGAHQ